MPIVSGEDLGAATVNLAFPSRLTEIPSGLLRSLLRWLRSVGVRVGQKRLLLGACWTTGSLALLLLFCAITMDSWLFTVEREPDEASNATFLITLHSGLWRFCKKNLFMKEVGKNTQWNISWREFLHLLIRFIIFLPNSNINIFYCIKIIVNNHPLRIFRSVSTNWISNLLPCSLIMLIHMRSYFNLK